ncbi:stress-induced-phosphoprotein 1-like [Chironomus tepperi]|uniref:stress-induced-phosphoprotein 1-like n=1 Tax=Chironomus tepperi TaxID=113505 RepID=UPI00391F5772
MEQQEDEVTALREKGNQCVKDNDFKQAIVFYSDALRKATQDWHILFSNRSFAYLKEKLYFYALSDAEKVIELNPMFVKGYFRKAEVLKECCMYDEAILSYGRALKLEPTNNTIITNLRQTALMCNREVMLERNIPFVGAGCGVIVAIIIVIFDQFTKTPTLKNPMLMVLIVMCIAAVGFLIAKIYRYYLKLHRKGLIQEPTDLSKDFLVNDQSTEEQGDDNELPKKKNRYTKSQARLRFKKGKS